jgi:hypothetical protein
VIGGRLPLAACAVATALALAAPAGASAPGGTSAGLRAAAARLVSAELAGDGATACGVLNVPLTATIDGRTCAQRWDSRSATLRATARGRRALRADLRDAASAPVTISGLYGSIALPAPLLNGASRFFWTANCWMLVR